MIQINLGPCHGTKRASVPVAWLSSIDLTPANLSIW